MMTWVSKLAVGVAWAASGLLPAHAWAADHVLVMTINYPAPNGLQGVKYDAANALQIAQKLGYDTSRAKVLKDDQLTANGIRAAFRDLTGAVRQNDRAFVYYSGHGASVKQGTDCVQALVTNDLQLINTAELTQMLDGIKTQVSDAFVVFDACHAGGNRDIVVQAARRGSPVDAPRLHAKVWTPKSGETCEGAANLARRFDRPRQRGMFNPDQNITFIAAANEREQALDDSERGGLATLGLLQCVNQGVGGVSGSALTSVKDLAACAQGFINEETPKVSTHHKPHTIEVYGNSGRALAAVSPKPEAGSSQQESLAVRVKKSFQQLEASSNGNWAFTVLASAVSAEVGKTASLSYRSSEPGYGYLLYVGSDLKDIKQLFPAQGTHQLLPASMAAPAQLGDLRIEAPAGENTFLFIMSKLPMDLSSALSGGEQAELGVAVKQLRELQCAALPVGTGGGVCAKQRNASFQPAGGAVQGYAAAAITVTGR